MRKENQKRGDQGGRPRKRPSWTPYQTRKLGVCGPTTEWGKEKGHIKRRERAATKWIIAQGSRGRSDGSDRKGDQLM